MDVKPTPLGDIDDASRGIATPILNEAPSKSILSGKLSKISDKRRAVDQTLTANPSAATLGAGSLGAAKSNAT